ncbi:MAG: LTA synthase family protein [bacterium]|nr:LTA synthase family protein [bacterium]
MLALYIFALGASGGTVGVFVRSLLGAENYIPGFRGGVMVAVGVACGYMALQILYMVVLQFLWPAKGNTYLFVESLSHAAVLVFVPYLLHIEIAWPHPMLAKVEPLIYVGCFCALHGILKLVSFYAVLRSEPGGRFATLAWLGGACLCGVGAFFGVQSWYFALVQARPLAPTQTGPVRVGSTYAEARAILEGVPLEGSADLVGRGLTLRLANDHNAERPLSGVYVTVDLQGTAPTRVERYLKLNRDGWATFRLSDADIPPGASSYSVWWQEDEEPSWRAMTGLRPVRLSDRSMLVSGPSMHQERDDEDTQPSFVIIAIEGLGAAHMSCMGYERDTTPMIDRMAFGGRVFAKAFAPAPEAGASMATTLTGVNPLRHGVLGRQTGPLADNVQTLAEVMRHAGYATAAFVESDGAGDLKHGTGLERGFETYDVGYAADVETSENEDPAPTVGSAATLQAATAWAAEHADEPFLLVLRLHELREVRPRPRYGAGFIEEGAKASARDTYDGALLYMDTQVGAFVRRLWDAGLRRHLCVAVTSPYAFAFKRDQARVGLTEDSLHVPLILRSSILGKARHTKPAGLDDLAPTLAAMADASFATPVDGVNLRLGLVDRNVVSMTGDPLTLTVRSAKWRLLWESNRRPFTEAQGTRDTSVALYDVSQGDGMGRNLAARYPEETNRLQDILKDYASVSVVTAP